MEYVVVSTIDWYNLKTFARLAMQYFCFYRRAVSIGNTKEPQTRSADDFGETFLDVYYTITTYN